jgi:glyoxylase-like metal-dependent hydrolase (beta-lactamase superfamily II)
MRFLVDPVEVEIVKRLEREERLHLVDGSAEPYPGIVATRLGGHTPGQLIVDVGTDSGRVVLASDAMHYYEEIDRDRPYNLFNDLGDMYRAYDILRDLRGRPETTLVAGHDPQVRALYEATQPDCIDLTAPIR